MKAVGVLLVAAGAAGLLHPASAGAPPEAELVSLEKIWDRAPHNAFTDLIRFRGRWYCAFREGSTHVSEDGAIRVLTSADGERWITSASIAYTGTDLRDPKLSVTSDQRLALNAAAAYPPPSPLHHQSLLWYSLDGRDWSDPLLIGDPNIWLWRLLWRRGKAYSVGYSTQHDKFLNAYISLDGKNFELHAPRVFDRGAPSEAALLFDNDESALCLLRRDGEQPTAQLGFSHPPYRAWTWKDLGVRIGGPALLKLPNGRYVAGGRLYDGNPRTALCWLDPEQGTLTEFLRLPSSGDNSYPGLVFHDDLLWVTYYSSHEGKASIYLAKVKLPAPGGAGKPKPSFSF